MPTEPRIRPSRPGHSRTGRERPLTASVQVRGRSLLVWRVEDSNLGSFRDGFTVRSQRRSRHHGAVEAVPTVNIRLWRADAIVLFDWLKSTDLNTVPITHPAQKQALADLLSRFEWAADDDVTNSTADEIAAAQADVAKDMGW
jgi:hypothetical protein